MRSHVSRVFSRSWLATLAVSTLVVIGALFAVPAHAQLSDGNLEGRVLDASGAPVPDARVTIEGPNLLGRRMVATNADGWFRAPGVPVGEYTVEIQHIAHRPATFEHVQVQLGATTSMGVTRLETRAVEMPKVTVTANRPRIDPTTTTTGTTLSASTFKALPTERNFKSIVTLAPQVNTTYTSEDANVGGMTGEGNYYFIDGVDVTDPAMGGTSIGLPYDFVRAIEVKTGGYDAEYGRALGGVVNLVTPSGGNAKQRQVFGYYTDHRLVGTPANSLLEGDVGDFSSYDFGGSFGGPLVQDKVYSFVAYNPTSDSRDAAVPGLDPLANWDHTHRFAAKLGWQATPGTNFSVMALGDPGQRRIVGVPFGMASPPSMVLNSDAVYAETKDGGAVVALTGTHQLRPNLLLKGSVSGLERRAWVTPLSEVGNTEPFFIDLETNTASGGYGGAQKNQQRRIAGKLNASLFTGRHTWKTGVEYQDNSITNDMQAGAGRDHAGWIYRMNDSTYQWFQAYGVGNVHLKLPSVFVQDSWRATDRIRLNAGVRWDGNYMIDLQGNTALRVVDGFQPRLGVVLLPGTLNNHKISASYGRYYEQLPTQSPGYYFFDSKQLYIDYDHDPRVDPTGGDTTAVLAAPPGSRTVEGEYQDEFNLGYEVQMPRSMKLGVRGTLRELGQAIEDGYNADQDAFVIGNPGSGEMADYPKATHRYTALELTLDRAGDRSEWQVAYVLSRTYGNYAGIVSGNAGPQFDFVETTVNATGYLPNDRRHVVKLHHVYRSPIGLSIGNSWMWASGAPISELGAIPGLPYTSFLTQRGTAGRTSSLWDWNVRLAQPLPSGMSGARAKLTLDLFHMLSPRKAVTVDERHYFSDDGLGNPTDENPDYGTPTLYQPAFSARLGATLEF